MDKQIIRRRNYFIDKNFQAKFIIKFCIIVVLSSVFIIGLLLWRSSGSNTVAIENTKIVVKNTSDFILPITLEVVFAVSIASGIAVLILTLLVSHKIAGPLYRLTREINALSEGDLTRNFVIRGGDQLQNLSKSLFAMSSSLRERFQNLKEKHASLMSYMKERNFIISDRDREEVIRILDEIDKRLANFKT